MVYIGTYTLFFRTEKIEYRERLIRMFPLAFGIVNNNYYVLLHQQEQIQKKVTELSKEVDALKTAAEKIKRNIVPYINEAKELGIIDKHFSTSSTKLSK